MESPGPSPFFSVIIPTRNRPVWFLRALRSVLEQSFREYEVIVVVDGSTDACLAKYREEEARYPDVGFHYLVQRPAGHGQSYSMNYGVQHSSGRYLCFLDDDDFWTDMSYLQSTYENIQACGDNVDVQFSNQRAMHSDDLPHTKNVWLEDLTAYTHQARHCHGDGYIVDAEFLLQSTGFAHLNCSIFRREFYESIGGMDESIRYENDRDMYLRAIDAARVIVYHAACVSRHNIPDVSKKDNMSTVATDIEKKLYQMRVYDKGICGSRNSSVAKLCRRSKAYELKHAATILARKGNYPPAFHYAREALLTGFNIRWLLYTLYLAGLSLLRGDSRN